MTSKTLLRGGCVLTMGARTPNLPQADVLIEDTLVTEVGTGLRARDAEQVDATDAIVMPGFVDTHRHTWRSLFRNLGEGPINKNRPASALTIAEHYGPDDLYASTLVGLLGAVESGITTVVDWSEAPVEGGFAEAALQAHVDAGLRTVFVQGPSRTHAAGNGAASARGDPFTRLAETAGPMTSVALGAAALPPSDVDGLVDAWAMARELGLRIHVHAGPGAAQPGSIAELAQQGLLADDVTLVHCSRLADEDLEAIASSGASVSLAPSNEMAGLFGSPPVQQLIDRNIRPGLGIDEEGLTPGDLFAQMRAIISLQHATVFDRKLSGKAGVPRLMSTREVIRHATADGARAAGLRDVSGSLEPGMQADLIVLRTDRPNIFPINDPIGAVVWGMDTSNVEWVFAGGRALVRNGVLQGDVGRARDLATAAHRRVAANAGIAVGAGGTA
jgi:5-methylthioadenosine/S-adenosylhomocysteine deaminase